MKIRYRSISFENLIHEYLLGLMIHEYLLRLHANSQFHLELFHFHFPNFQELLYINLIRPVFSRYCWSHVVQLLLHQWQKPCFYDSSASTSPAKAHPEPRPRPVLQLVDQSLPEIAPFTEANVQGTTPAPRPRNRDILRQRAESIRADSIKDDASIRAPSSRRSRSHRSRSPGRQSTQVTGQVAFSPSPPNIEAPPGQWSLNTQGIWNQYGVMTTPPPPPPMTDPQMWRPPAVVVPQPRPPGFPYCTFAPRQDPQVGQSPPGAPGAS